MLALYPSRDFSTGARNGYMLFDEADWNGRHLMAIDVAVARRRFSVEEYHRMGEVGILKETDHVELIRGEIVEMSPQGFRHRAFIDNLTRLLITRLGDRAVVSIQMPIVLADD